ncbi:hypothetical protein QTN25_010370 [Entamoeba marina]
MKVIYSGSLTVSFDLLESKDYIVKALNDRLILTDIQSESITKEFLYNECVLNLISVMIIHYHHQNILILFSNDQLNYSIWVTILASKMPSVGMFSLPLHVAAYKTKTKIPIPVIRTIEYLKIHMESFSTSFFQHSISDKEKEEINTIITSFNNENDVDSKSFSSPVIAFEVLKIYISMLPTVLIHQKLQFEMINALRKNDITSAQNLIGTLLSESTAVVVQITQLLYNINQNKQCNKEVKELLNYFFQSKYENDDFDLIMQFIDTMRPLTKNKHELKEYEYPISFGVTPPPCATLYYTPLIEESNTLQKSDAKFKFCRPSMHVRCASNKNIFLNDKRRNCSKNTKTDDFLSASASNERKSAWKQSRLNKRNTTMLLPLFSSEPTSRCNSNNDINSDDNSESILVVKKTDSPLNSPQRKHQLSSESECSSSPLSPNSPHSLPTSRSSSLTQQDSINLSEPKETSPKLGIMQRMTDLENMYLELKAISDKQQEKINDLKKKLKLDA